LMLEHAFSSVDSVVFNIGKNNWRSRKAVEKIGGHLINSETHPQLIELIGDHVTYLIEKANWV